MTEMAGEMSWLLDGKGNLMRLKQEFWLTEAEIAIIDRGIAAIDRFLIEPTSHDPNRRRSIAATKNFR